MYIARGLAWERCLAVRQSHQYVAHLMRSNWIRALLVSLTIFVFTVLDTSCSVIIEHRFVSLMLALVGDINLRLL